MSARTGFDAARRAVAGAALVATVLVAPGRIPALAGAPSEEEARRRADEASEALVQELMPRLGAALNQGGPSEGIRVCSEIAQTTTREIGSARSLVLKRTSLRTRNTADAPDAYERRWLEQAHATHDRGEVVGATYEVVETPDGSRELRHLRPILFPGGICSGCHGPIEKLSAEVRALLAERYPDDRAVGFEAGDLRGAISVRVALDASETGPSGPPRSD